jgi:hypothetical protein
MMPTTAASAAWIALINQGLPVAAPESSHQHQTTAPGMLRSSADTAPRSPGGPPDRGAEGEQVGPWRHARRHSSGEIVLAEPLAVGDQFALKRSCGGIPPPKVKCRCAETCARCVIDSFLGMRLSRV